MSNSRNYVGESDLSRIKRFLSSSRAIHGACGYFHIGDLLWRMFSPSANFEATKNIRLWENKEDRLLGFAWFNPHREVEFFPTPSLWGSALEREMHAWAEQRARKFFSSHPSIRLDTGCFEEDTKRSLLLRQRGFEATNDFIIHYRRSLSIPIPDVTLPAGFSVRNLSATEDDFNRIVEERSYTVEGYHRLTQAPGYVPELDLVALAPNGTIASYCICWFDDVEDSGEFEPVGTKPNYRRMGLAKAVMSEALRRIKARGARNAFVAANGANPPAIKLYESLGFQKIGCDFTWTKTIKSAS